MIATTTALGLLAYCAALPGGRAFAALFAVLAAAVLPVVAA